MRARSLLLMIPLLWIVVTAFTGASGHPWSSNHVTLNRLGDWIARFQKDQNRLPESLAEVRTYAYSMGELPALYDSFGTRFYYAPLTEVAFVLKSFGRDAAENTVLLSKDETYAQGLNYPPPSLRSETPDASQLNFYQSSFLEGLESSKGSLSASLKTRFRGQSKRLVIQNKTDREFVMISYHDAVEEFIWLPGGFEIIFTAQGSKRYEDGIYYWNLTTNEVVNILPKLKEKYFPKIKEDSKFFLSLSHVSASPTFLYFFAAPSSESLDPKNFYRYQNFYAINPRNGFSVDRVTADKDFSIFDYTVDQKSLLDLSSLDGASPAQKEWTRLPLSGDKQVLLEAWQSYCTNHSATPGLPYALWWLASLYNDTYRDLLEDQPEKARIIRNYGLEIIDALSSLPTAPLYLHGFAEHLKKNLLLSKPADYNVASSSLESVLDKE